MKRVLLCLFLSLSVFVFSYAQEGYKIIGQVAGLPDEELFLVADSGIKTDTLAQTQSMNGHFLFAGRVNGVVMTHIVTAKQEIIASMMLENKDFSVLGQGLVAGGGAAQKLLALFNQLDEGMVQERKRLEQQYVEAEKKKDKKKMEALDAKFRKFLTDAQARELELLQQYADTYVAAYIVASTMREVGAEKLNMRYDLLGEHAKATSYGKAIAVQIERYKQVENGSIMPDFKLTSLGNEIISLHEKKAKLKIVNFWAAWSAPCRTENVNLLRIYEQYHLKGVEIFSVYIDDNQAAWRKAVTEDGMIEWQHVSDLKGQFSDLMLTYCLQTIPYTFVLDSDNVIVAQGVRGEALKRTVEGLLKKK